MGGGGLNEDSHVQVHNTSCLGTELTTLASSAKKGIPHWSQPGIGLAEGLHLGGLVVPCAWQQNPSTVLLLRVVHSAWKTM